MKMYPMLSVSAAGEEPPRHCTRKDWARPASPDRAAWRVRAGVTVPAGVVIGPYPSEMLLGINTADQPKGDKYIEVKMKENTLVACPDVDAPRHWLLHVTPARDRHEQNVEAMRDSRGLIVFRVIKVIHRGQELLVWYSAELALECNIPILTPANIRSDQEYACTACDATFRYPNTLKAHVRFHCPRSSMTSWLGQYSPLQGGSLFGAYQQELTKYFSHLGTLWGLRRVGGPDLGLLHPAAAAFGRSAFRPCATASSGTDANSSPLFSPSRSPLIGRKKLSDGGDAETALDRKRNSDDGAPRGTTTTTSTATPPIVGYPTLSPIPSYLDKMYMYNYAQYMRTELPQFPVDLTSSLRHLPAGHRADFSPVSGRDPTSGSRERASGRQQEDDSPPADRDSPSQPSVTAMNFPMPSDTAGEPIDLLPKSLYMSKAYKGHLCIYCGKLYSRKYGLKIHLRTHTGYKPLKCKVCLRPFGDPSNLNKHIRLHAEGDTPYRCEHCGKVLVRRRDLERHVKSRHPGHAHLDEHSDADASFVDVDVDDDDDDDGCPSPIDMRRQEIEVT